MKRRQAAVSAALAGAVALVLGAGGTSAAPSGTTAIPAGYRGIEETLPTQYKAPAVRSGSSCTIGKRILNDKGFVAWKHRLTPLPNENAEEIVGQYYFGPSLFFEGSGGSSNISGADVIWRHRW